MTVATSNEDIINIRKILTYRNKDKLAKLLEHSRSNVRVSGTFGSRYNSLLSTFEIYSPIKQHDILVNLSENEINDLMEAILQIYPVKDNAEEITNIEFYLDTENIDAVIEDEFDGYELSNYINTNKGLLGFISYSHEDKIIAGEIKKKLDSLGFEVFLAHEDIEPTTQWEKEIYKNLKECDVFIALISNNFKNSKWTDQETGIAYRGNKFIIPISINMAPYGFINKFQALYYKDDVDECCNTIISTLISSPVSDKFKNSMINNYINSKQFSDANIKENIIAKCEPYADNQVNKILFGFLVNDQVREAFSGKRIVNGILSKYSDKIFSFIKIAYEEFKNNGDFPIAPIYSNKKRIIELFTNVISHNSKLTKDKINELIEKDVNKFEGENVLFDSMIKIAFENKISLK